MTFSIMTFDRPRAAVTAAGFCAFLDLYAPQAVLPELAATIHISPAEAGTIVGISTLAVAIAAPFVGVVSDRIGHKRTIVLAILLLTIPTVMVMAATSLPEILVWRFIQGLFLPGIFSSTVAYVNEEWKPAEAADLMGVYVAGTAFGGFGGRFVTALMADHFGWRSGFAVLTALTLICAAVVWKWLPAGRGKPRSQIRTLITTSILQHLRTPALLSTFAAGFAVLFSLVGAFTYVNFHLAAAPYGFSPAQLGMVFLVYPIGALVTPISGPMVRRWGRSTAMVMAVAIGCCGLLVTLRPELPLIVSGLALFVTGVFLAQTAAMGFVGQAARSAKSTAVGLYVCFYYVGGSVGAVLPGGIWAHAGWTGCVALLIVTMACAAALTLWGWAKHRPSATSLSPHDETDSFS